MEEPKQFTCNKCRQIKNKDEFHKSRNNKRGIQYSCKKCNNKDSVKWRKDNPQKVIKYNKKWKDENPDYYKDYINIQGKKEHKNQQSKEYYNVPENKKRKQEYSKEYNNRPYIKKRKAEYYKENKKEILQRNKEHRQKQENKDRRNKLEKERRENDEEYRLRCSFSKSITQDLKKRSSNKGNKSAFDCVPYTLKKLKDHLESQFETWMNWGNYGNKKGCWSLDHIIPKSFFKYTSSEDEEFQECWALSNLQPLKHIENCSKRDKIINN